MATTAEFIGVYIVDIITTATITIIVATIITITAIGETRRVVAVSKTSSPQAQGSQHTLFPFPTASNIAKLPTYLAANPNAANE